MYVLVNDGILKDYSLILVTVLVIFIIFLLCKLLNGNADTPKRGTINISQVVW